MELFLEMILYPEASTAVARSERGPCLDVPDLLQAAATEAGLDNSEGIRSPFGKEAELCGVCLAPFSPID